MSFFKSPLFLIGAALVAAALLSNEIDNEKPWFYGIGAALIAVALILHAAPQARAAFK